MNTTPVESDSRPIFGIFEGGGAKAIAHVGAYAAADEMDLEFVGVAGASAGSIVASLIAVGFSPDEIFDPQTRGRDIFATHQLTPIDVLGPAQWRLFQRLKTWWRWTLGAIALLIGTSLAAALFGELRAARIGACASLLAAGLLAVGTRRLLLRRGIFDPAHFARAFNQVLHRRVTEVYARDGKDTSQIPANIRFRDIEPLHSPQFCRLKVVATDVTGQELRLFDHRTPDVVVAEAVAASIAIPGIFKPAKIPSYVDAADVPCFSRDYADGGLVSNLPVWCLAEEKAAIERLTRHNAPVPLVAFTLGDAAETELPAVAASPLKYFARVLLTGIFGGQTVVQELVSDLYTVRLQCPLGVLAFDADRERAVAAFQAGKQQAAQSLRRRLDLEPRAWREALDGACNEVRRVIEAQLARLGLTRAIHLRAGIWEPMEPSRTPLAATAERTHRPTQAFRVTHAFNMDEDPDDRLTLGRSSPGVPQAFELRSISLLAPSPGLTQSTAMTKYERALVRRTMKSAICVPLFGSSEEWNVETERRGRPLAVVSFDSDDDIVSCVQEEDSVLESIVEITLGLGGLLAEAR